MKSVLALFLSNIFVVSAAAQPNPANFNLTLEFGPSFLSASELIIQNKGDSDLINIRVYKNYRTREFRIDDQVIVPFTRMSALVDFFKTYKFNIRTNIDTVGAHKVFENGDSVLAYEVIYGTDGINVNGLFGQNGITHKFAFWSPDKGTENARLMGVVFDLIGNVFTNPQTVNYIEQLTQYFPHHLGVKKLSDYSPLTYKLYGTISSDDQDELDTFLKSLPLHPKVIIDMSNFSGMGTMFYTWFEDYCAHKKNIYWLNPTEAGLIDLYMIGIPNQYVISKKKIRKIKNVDGRKVILYNTD